MAGMCDGCGERATRWSYAVDGPWAGKWLCRECNARRRGLKKLSLAVQFRFKIGQVLPPGDAMTVPLLRLMMAVDDVRRAQIQMIESHERLGAAPRLEKYLTLGDLLYAIRRLCSHLHEAGRALRSLDTVAARRVDALLAGNSEALAALGALRTFFNAADYGDSFVANVRNAIGFHYLDQEIRALANGQITADALGEATAAEVGGLARMADVLVYGVIDNLAGGDLLVGGPESTKRIGQALDLAGNLTTFVDHLFDSLMRQHPDAIVEKHEGVIEIPPMVQLAREAVDAARKRTAGARDASVS